MKLSEKFRKTDNISHQAKFVRIKQKTLPQKFEVNYRQTAGDSYLNKYKKPIVLTQHIKQVYLSKQAQI